MTFIRHASVLCISAVMFVACGGDDADSGSDTTSTSGTSTPATTESGGGDGADGKALFVSTCGGCHTLADADTNGAVGPKLDGRGLDAAAVAAKITSGGGGMPPGLVEGDEKDAIAAYVAGAAS